MSYCNYRHRVTGDIVHVFSEEAYMTTTGVQVIVYSRTRLPPLPFKQVALLWVMPYREFSEKYEPHEGEVNECDREEGPPETSAGGESEAPASASVVSDTGADPQNK